MKNRGSTFLTQGSRSGAASAHAAPAQDAELLSRVSPAPRKPGALSAPTTTFLRWSFPNLAYCKIHPLHLLHTCNTKKGFVKDARSAGHSAQRMSLHIPVPHGTEPSSSATRALGPPSSLLPARQHCCQKLTYFILKLYKCILFLQKQKASIWHTNPQIGCIASLNYLWRIHQGILHRLKHGFDVVAFIWPPPVGCCNLSSLSSPTPCPHWVRHSTPRHAHIYTTQVVSDATGLWRALVIPVPALGSPVLLSTCKVLSFAKFLQMSGMEPCRL